MVVWYAHTAQIAISERIFQMSPIEIAYLVLCSVLLLAALFIIDAVVFQKSSEEGLSSTIAGGAETYLGKDKRPSAGKIWFKWTIIVSIVLAVIVFAVYVIQPDYSPTGSPNDWQQIVGFPGVFK